MKNNLVNSVVLLFAAALIAAGCNTMDTVVRPFTNLRPDYTVLPEDAMRELARDLEEAVRRGEREPDLGEYDGLSLDTERIRLAIRKRAARAELVSNFLASGHAYEKRNGLVAILRSRAYKDSTTRRQRDRDALLVMGENDDRWALYEGLVKHNDLPPKALDAIQAIFHDVQVEMLEPGEKYEDAEGDLHVKGQGPVDS